MAAAAARLRETLDQETAEKVSPLLSRLVIKSIEAICVHRILICRDGSDHKVDHNLTDEFELSTDFYDCLG